MNNKQEIPKNKGNKKNKNWGKRFAILFLISLFTVPFFIKEDVKEISYKEFNTMVDKKTVEKVELNRLDGTMIVYSKNKSYKTESPNYEGFKKSLLEKDIKATEVAPQGFLARFSSLMPLFLLILIGGFFYIQTKQAQGIQNITKGRESLVIEKPKTTMKDVAGVPEVKKDVQNLINFLRNPSEYHKKGARMPKGLMLYGEPGTGKTLIGKAIAGEAGVPFFSVNGSEFIEKFVGVGASRVREIFKQAKEHSPAVIFIDEIDTIGGKRSGEQHSEQIQTLNALLSEMDGFEENTNILVIATTNRLENLDEALVRPGRFDMHVKVPVPENPEERLEVIKIHSKGKTFDESVDFNEYAKDWMGFSGADIESILNEATIISVNQGKEKIDAECLEEAYLKKTLKGHLKQDAQGKRNSDELKLVAYHEAGHAVVGKLVDSGMDVRKVTIISSTTGAGGFALLNPRKEGLHTIEELEARIMGLYAGRIAEQILFNDKRKVTTGAHSDITQASHIIKSYISEFGMSEEVGMLNLNIIAPNKLDLLEESKRMSARIYNKTLQLMTDNWHLVEAIAKTLLEKDTIVEDEIDAIINTVQISAVSND